MKDLHTKLWLLFALLAHAFHEWKREIWNRDLDETYCCDGRECGCMASSVREVWAFNARKQK